MIPSFRQTTTLVAQVSRSRKAPRISSSVWPLLGIHVITSPTQENHETAKSLGLKSTSYRALRHVLLFFAGSVHR